MSGYYRGLLMDLNLFQNVAFSGLDAVGLPRRQEIETLQNSLESRQIHRFLIEESLNSGDRKSVV